MKNSILWKYFCMSLVFLSVFYSSCVTPDPFTKLSPEEKDLYITNRDKSIDFSQYKTYVIVDSVNVVTKESGITSDSVSSAPFILSTVESELQKAGFVKVDTSMDPDVGISVSLLRFEDEIPITYFPYVGGAGYSGYISPAFYGFPSFGYSFPPYYGYYQIQVGSISIEMFDLKSARVPGQSSLNVIWSAVLVGTLADGSTDNSNDRIVKAISGAFAQSPYLKEGK